MKLIVTGGFGFIGSHVVEEALTRGHDVLVIDKLTYAGRTANLHECSGDFAWVREDICDAVAMNEVFAGFKPDAVIHLAAETHVTRSITCHDEFLRTNINGTHTLLEAAVRHGEPHFIHVSTDEVYGTYEGPDGEGWTRRSPYWPRNPYAASKAASDHLVSAYAATFSLDTTIVHCANNFGNRQHPEKVVPTFVRQALLGMCLTLHGDGLHRRDWLHVADTARFLISMAETRCTGIHNLQGAGELTNLTLARMVLTECGVEDGRIAFVPDRPGNDRRYLLAPYRWRLSHNPTTTLASELPRIVQWHRDNIEYGTTYGR